MKIEQLPRVRLAELPTPLFRASRLSEELGGPDIWIKRDDLTGLAFGGNKSRKLEFLMADALEKGCDYVLTIGAAQSNHACQTASAASRLGIPALLVLSEPETDQPQGNLLLDKLMGVEMKLIPGYGVDKLEQAMAQETERLQQEGHRPYPIPLGGGNGLGAIGYALAAHEVEQQAKDLGIKIDYSIVAAGSGGTQAGLLLGKRLFGYQGQVLGINVGSLPGELAPKIAQVASEAAAILGEQPVSIEEVIVYDDYVGPKYAAITPECLEAVKLVARTEGIFFDPVYTGKAMAGLIDLCKQGKFKAQDNVVFWHTGGGPGLFARADELIQ